MIFPRPNPKAGASIWRNSQSVGAFAVLAPDPIYFCPSRNFYAKSLSSILYTGLAKICW